MERFHKRFGLELGVEEAKRRFVNRVLNFLLDTIPHLAADKYGWPKMLHVEKLICNKLGERWTDEGCLKGLVGTDYDTCLRALEALYCHPDFGEHVDTEVKDILTTAEIDIGIRWGNGQFLPAGAPFLDDALVNDPLNLLNIPEYKGVSDAFRKGLDHFLHSTKNQNLLADVLTDMYEALEAAAKIACKNGKDRDLSANREVFISNLGLADPYKRMLKEYIEYANKFGRHAGPEGKSKPIPSRKEVEAFVYLTGLFIRVAVSENS